MNMCRTYSKLYVHIVFSVKGRNKLLPQEHHEELYKYISGIVNNKKQKLMAVNGTEDHIHIFASIAADIRISDLVQQIKSNSSRFINEKQWNRQRFAWQEGFGAFSYSESMKGIIINYIHKQKEHHKKIEFKDEYLNILEKFGIQTKTKPIA